MRFFRGLAACLAGPDRGMFLSAVSAEEDEEEAEAAWQKAQAARAQQAKIVTVPEWANLDAMEF